MRFLAIYLSPLAETPPCSRTSKNTGTPTISWFNEMNETNALFDLCRSELEARADDLSFELGSESFLSPRDYEEIKVLFNLAKLSIEDPNQEKAKIDSFITSDLRKVSAEELSTVLEATELAMDIPTISLKEIKQEAFQKITQRLLSSQRDNISIFKAHTKKALPAGFMQRLTSFSIDLTCVTILALCLTLSLVWLEFRELTHLLRFEEPADLYSYLPLISLAVNCLLVTFYLYPLICWKLFETTLGKNMTRLKIRSRVSRSVSFTQFLLRTLLSPLAIIISIIRLGGDFRATLHDQLADTQITR